MIHTAEMKLCIDPDLTWVFRYMLTRLGISNEEAYSFVEKIPRMQDLGDGYFPKVSSKLQEQLDIYNENNRYKAIHDFKVSYAYDCCYLSFRIDLNQLLTGKKSVELFEGSEENRKLLYEKYQLFMRELFPPPLVDNWESIDKEEYYEDGIFYEDSYLDEISKDGYEGLKKVYDFHCADFVRVDFSANIDVEKDLEDLVPLYIILLNKSVHSKQLKRPDKDKAAWKYNNLYRSNGSTVVTIYDKYQEVCSRIPEEGQEHADAKGILRFEVQYKKARISRLYSKYREEKFNKAEELVRTLDIGWLEALSQLQPFNDKILSEEFSLDILSKTANQLLPHGDWYNKYYAYEKINDPLKESTANKVIEFLELVQNSQSLKKGYHNFTSTATDKTYQTRIKQLRECDVAPYLIPRHLYTKYGLAERLKDGMLPNPFKELQGICC